MAAGVGGKGTCRLSANAMAPRRPENQMHSCMRNGTGLRRRRLASQVMGKTLMARLNKHKNRVEKARDMLQTTSPVVLAMERPMVMPK